MSFWSCEIIDGLDDPVFCTEEFRFVTLEVNGGVPESFFTLRKSTGDTIRFEQQALFDNQYPVLDDSYQDELEGKTDEFEFVGFQGDSEVIREVFEIKADECHIEKVSGPTAVTI